MTAGNGTVRKENCNEAEGILESYSWGIAENAGDELLWNNRGSITQIKMNGTAYDYEYDGRNQINKETRTSEAMNTWNYDSKGNRSRSNGKSVTCYENSDLIKDDGTWKYSYDMNGNLVWKGKSGTSKTEATDNLYEGWSYNATSGEVWYYGYDNFNRLVLVKKSTAGTDGLKKVAEYTYDYRDLVVCRNADEYFEYTPEGTLIYDGRPYPNSERDYVYANGAVWCELTEAGNVFYHHTDHLGTTEYMTDKDGTVVWQCEYEAFGKVIKKSGSKASSFKPMYTGKQMDESTGLYYFNARWYDHGQGRFITQDPARDGGNWCIYCRNRPLIMIDKNGKEVPPQYQERNNQKSEESRYELARKHSLLNEIEMNWNSDLDLQNYIKNNSVIEITRNVDDNENNGKYYRSDVKLKVGDVTIFESKIQSTADHSKLNNGEPRYEGRTIDPGDYVGTLLNKSGTYLNAISITGNDVSESEGVLMHPDAKTALGQTESYSSIRKPSSLACQILELNNFDKMINSIHNLGFKSGKAPVSDPNLSWCKGDKINIKIKEAE